MGTRRPPRGIVERQSVARAAVEAVLQGHPNHFHQEGDCTDPAVLDVRGYPDPITERAVAPVTGVRYVRCRRCPMCLEHRSRLWAARAIDETLLGSGRTWFGTLTLRPERQYRAELMARDAARRSGVSWDELSATERFRRHHAQLVPEIQGMLDRLRKRAGPIRYLLTTEVHRGGGLADGWPHYHCLIHEKARLSVKHADLSDVWQHGFTKFKLVEEGEEKKHCFYVCKYLAKDASARIMASQRYGRLGIKAVTVVE